MKRPPASSLPSTPGVYLYKDARGVIIYVGKARNLRQRVFSYFRTATALSAKTVAMISHAACLETLSTTTEKEALLLEASLIKKHRPRYNIVLRDDKQYVLFRIGKESAYPRLEIVRNSRKDGARYFGPFTSGLAARETWKAIHRVFPLRRCSERAFKNRVRPCLYHHLGQCLAPCTELISVESYGALVHRVALLLSGRSRELLDMLRRNMDAAAVSFEYEQAAVFRDQIRAVERTLERQSVVLPAGVMMDVAGITPVKGGLGLGLLFIRDGRLVDGRTFFWPDLDLADGPELLWSFLSQFYGHESSIPPRIVVPWLPDADEQQPNAPCEPDCEPDCEADEVQHCSERSSDAPDDALSESVNERLVDLEAESASAVGVSLEALEAALSDIREGSVRIAIPRNVAESRLVDMAVSNAREAARSEQPIGTHLARIFALPADHSPSALLRDQDSDDSQGSGSSDSTTVRAIRRVECVDVSHTGGESTRVGMVVFEDGQPLKSAYRTYALEGEDACHGDDYAALGVWARRRVASGPPWADLVLIDGGRGQISAVFRVLRELDADTNFILAGIAKARDERGRADRRAGNVGDRIFLAGRINPLPLREGSAELLFLQHVRDTAHHFVIGRHRRARAYAALDGELLRIPGVGKATASLLWKHFGTLANIVGATQEELTALPGIGARKAQMLAERLQSLKKVLSS